MVYRLPWYVPLMFVLTGIYLTLEVPFSGNLAGVIGGEATVADIHAMERFGRMLSGIAAAIAVVGVVVFPYHDRNYHSKRRALVTAAFVGSLTAMTVYVGLNAYADWRAAVADGAERKEAVVAMLAKRAMLSSGAAAALGLSDAQFNAFAAVMPEIIPNQTALATTGSDLMQLASYAGDDVKREIGSVSEAKDDFFKTNFSSARDAYDRYSESLSDIKRAYSDLDGEIERGWAEYTDRMNRNFPNGWPNTHTFRGRMAWRKVRFGEKIPVSENWNLRNKSEFVQAAKRKGVNEISERYAQAVDAQFGPGVHLKPGLTFEQFVAHPAVQKRIRESLPDGTPRNVVISPEMTLASFDSAFYSPQIRKAVGEMQETLSADPSDFEYGRFAEVGKDAVKARILPALAILLSLTGAVVHMFKFSGYGLQLLAHYARIAPLNRPVIRHLAVLVLLAGAGHYFLGVATTSVSAPAIEKIADQSIYARALVGAVALQPQLVAVSDKLETLGVWKLAAADLPAPRAFDYAPVSSVTKDAPVQAEPAVEVADAAGGFAIPVKVPVPTFRPKP